MISQRILSASKKLACYSSVNLNPHNFPSSTKSKWVVVKNIQIWITFVKIVLQAFFCHPGYNSETINKLIRDSALENSLNSWSIVETSPLLYFFIDNRTFALMIQKQQWFTNKYLPILYPYMVVGDSQTPIPSRLS